MITLTMLNVCSCYDESLVELARDVYSKLVDAEKKGADVRETALKLNRALQLIREAENDPEKKDILLSEARALIEDVNSSIPLLIREGERETFWKNVTIGSTGIITVVASVLTYLFGPRIFWEIWLKIRSRWIIEVASSRKKGGDVQ